MWGRGEIPLVRADHGAHGLARVYWTQPDDRNTYVVSGESENGMTHGTIAGMLLCDLIQWRENEWTTLYDPSRISLLATSEFVKENLNVAAQFRDYVSAGDVDVVKRITPGTGAIVRDGLKKLAVYRDSRGTLHTYSPICPHLGCLVNWNNVEHTWDCPGHGSRFDSFGKILNGPPYRCLDQAE